MEAKPIPVVICIDVEPDLDFFLTQSEPSSRATANSWDSFKTVFIFFENLRRKLSVKNPPVFSWFIRADQQVKFDFGSADFGFRRFEDYIQTWRAQGDEIGLHVHAWRQDHNTDSWIDDRMDQDWVESCVQMGVEAFESRMKQAPRSFRFGNRWMNTDTMKLVRRLGIEVDLTIEPGYVDSPWTPFLRGRADWTNVPHHPYFPSTDDYTREAEFATAQDLVELPMTTVRIPIGRKVEKTLALCAAMVTGKRNLSMVPHGPVLRELRWYFGSKNGRLDLLLSSRQFRKAVQYVLDESKTPYFALVLRSDDCGDNHAKSLIERNLRVLTDEIQRYKLSPIVTTPQKAVEILGINRIRDP